MMAAEIGERRPVDHRAGGGAQFALENGVGVGAGDSVHGVEAHAEAGSEQRADGVEVEQRAHQRGVIGDGVDDLDARAFDPHLAERVEIDIRRVDRLVGRNGLGVGENRVGDLLGRRAAVADIVLDAEIALRAAGIVAGGEDDPAVGADRADQRRDRRRRQDAALADDDAAEAVGDGDAHDGLDRLAIVIAPVAAGHQRLAGKAFERIEDRLDEVLDVVRLPEHRRLLAQARGAGLLVEIRRGGDGADHAGRPSRLCCWASVAGRKRGRQWRRGKRRSGAPSPSWGWPLR